jgi:hypothetical protein
MSLRVVLGTSLALMVVCPGWMGHAESKAKESSAVSDRHASPSRSGKAAASEERPRKARAQKDDSQDKASARKARVKQDEADDAKPARKARAKQDDADDEKLARKARAKQDDADDAKPARKARARNDDADDEKPARKGRGEKDMSLKETAAKGRAQKEAAQKEDVRKGRSAAESSSDGETAALKQQLRELRKQLADMERLRAELAAVKAQVRGNSHAAAEPSPDNALLAALKRQVRDLLKQVADTERLRAELAAIKAQVRNSTPDLTIWGGVPLTLPSAPSAQARSSPGIEAATLHFPDLRDIYTRPLQPPLNQAIDSLPAAIREQLLAPQPPKLAVEEAKAYLVRTATPGYTMTRQGAALAIERLHPAFAVKLAEAVKRAREEGMTEVGVFSAYRPPAFGIGGFKDKFDSLHSYGLATDITGIGGPGSPSAHHWHQIVMEVGLYLPYGPDHRVEFNHTQFIPMKVAPRELRETITADGPIDLRKMWLASGVDAYTTESPAFTLASRPGNDASADAAASAPDAITAPSAEPIAESSGPIPPE